MTDGNAMPVSAPAAPAEIAAVREKLIEHGWIQGALRSPAGVCLLGAVLHAVPVHRTQAVQGALDDYVVEKGLYPDDHASKLRPAAAYNDTPGRTLAEVTGMLTECQIRVKEKAGD